jgi:tetrahydromethanopterin S-methyltransferase subunit B
MARYYRRRGYRRRSGYRRSAPYGIDPLFWVALAIAVLVALIVVTR